MRTPLRVGVIGLGRRWKRIYQPALQAARDHWIVRMVYDQQTPRARPEAQKIDGIASSGIMSLLESSEVDVVLLADRQWFGLWPIVHAARLGKPVFCGLPLESDDHHADELMQQVGGATAPIMMALPAGFASSIRQAKELLDTTLGPAQLIRCEARMPSSAALQHQSSPTAASASIGVASTRLLDWCTALMPGQPSCAHAVRCGRLVSLILEYHDHRVVHINFLKTDERNVTPRLRVLTNQGSLTVHSLRRLSWRIGEIDHRQRMPWQPPLVQILLKQFHEAIRQETRITPNLADAYRVLTWLRSAHQSATERRAVPIVSN